MRIIKRFIVVALISVIANGVYAQTSKTNDAANLSVYDIARVKRHLAVGEFISREDSIIVMHLLENQNIPQKGTVAENGEIVSQSLVGDELVSYISSQGGCFWFSIVVSRKGEFIGRYDIRLD